jgi:hypothetical protein
MGMMNDGGLSIADAMALANGREGNEYGGFGGAGGTWIWVFFLFFLLAWGGNGFGFGGNGAATAAANLNGALTRADLCQDMNFQQLQNDTRSLQNGLCDGFYAVNTTLLNGFNAAQATTNAGFNGMQRDLCTGFNGVNQNINQSRFDMQQCCCETNRNLDATRYENAQNTCSIVDAIRQDGEATRALINANTMQDLRDRLADKDRDLMTAQFQISQQAQTTSIVNQVVPKAVPAYITCSPYEANLLASGLLANQYGGGCCA